MSNPVVIIGLDGADPELVSEWEEDLPNFHKIKKEGFFGQMDSIIPPITVPAWMSMFSSQGPEYFNVYDFQSLNFEEYEFDFVDSSQFKGKTILDSSKRTISFRVPGTTPKYQINGKMISGFVFGEELEFLDKELEQRVRENVGPEIRDLNGEDEKTASLRNFKENTEVFLFLLDDQDFDRAFSVFRIVDTWMHNVPHEEDMKKAYLEADRALGKFIDICKENNWNLLVVSDHGSVETNRKLYLNAWLREKDYLSVREQEERASKKLLYSIAKKGIELGFKPLLKKTANLIQGVSGKNLKPHKTDVMQKLEFGETEAFSYLSAVSNFGAIWINDKERFSQGIVEDREAKSKEIKQLLEQEGYIEEVFLNSDIYGNPQMPDIIVKTSDEVVVGPEIYPYKFHETNAVVHGFEGLITGFGPDLNDKEDEIKTDLINVGSTIQAIEGVVDEGRKGEVINSIIKDGNYKYRSEDLDEVDF